MKSSEMYKELPEKYQAISLYAISGVAYFFGWLCSLNKAERIVNPSGATEMAMQSMIDVGNNVYLVFYVIGTLFLIGAILRTWLYFSSLKPNKHEQHSAESVH